MQKRPLPVLLTMVCLLREIIPHLNKTNCYLKLCKLAAHNRERLSLSNIHFWQWISRIIKFMFLT